ncbi:hypothetical protein JGUZn3_23780 [Entomobacter blattae]|uniref:Uncharacterized protein n=2 Tax=Entomobacter blattae TaxID=2762277 RepID=A0A7H1NUW8_9PROT|nr:hypothetical protein JGUZn3_23780 [Entomobacter blattae]
MKEFDLGHMQPRLFPAIARSRRARLTAMGPRNNASRVLKNISFWRQGVSGVRGILVSGGSKQR